MRWERACLFAAYLGAMDRQLGQVVAFAKERRQFKKSLGKHQAIAHRIADMKLRRETARIVAYVATVAGRRIPLLELKTHCAKHLPRSMIIEAVRCSESLPGTPNGKIDRLSLPKI